VLAHKVKIGKSMQNCNEKEVVLLSLPKACEYFGIEDPTVLANAAKHRGCLVDDGVVVLINITKYENRLVAKETRRMNPPAKVKRKPNLGQLIGRTRGRLTRLDTSIASREQKLEEATSALASATTVYAKSVARRDINNLKAAIEKARQQIVVDEAELERLEGIDVDADMSEVEKEVSE
jgi:hypothetical protein